MNKEIVVDLLPENEVTPAMLEHLKRLQELEFLEKENKELSKVFLNFNKNFDSEF